MTPDLKTLARETASQAWAVVRADFGTDEIAAAILTALETAVGERVAENSRLEELVQEFQASGLIDVGNVGGPCCVEPKHIEQHVTELRDEIDQLKAQLEQARKDGDEMERKLRDAELFIEADFIDWAVISKDSPDYDPNYKPEFPAIVKELRAARANYNTTRHAGQEGKI